MSTTEAPELTGSNTEGKHLGLALAVIAGAQLMIILDATIVNVALPTIHRNLHFSVNNLEWLITAYSLTFGGLLLFGGRTGDLFGKRRMFMIGIAIFAVSSLLGRLRHDRYLAHHHSRVSGRRWRHRRADRALAHRDQLPRRTTAQSRHGRLRRDGWRRRRRRVSSSAACSSICVSWRWIFFVNVPIAAVILFLAPRALNESSTTSGKLDVPGALTRHRRHARPGLRTLQRRRPQLDRDEHTRSPWPSRPSCSSPSS